MPARCSGDTLCVHFFCRQSANGRRHLSTFLTPFLLQGRHFSIILTPYPDHIVPYQMHAQRVSHASWEHFPLTCYKLSTQHLKIAQRAN